MHRRWDRCTPLTSLVFVVLVVIGAVAAGNEPDGKASGTKVITYYDHHRGSEHLSAILLTLAFIALVFFAASLRSHLRRSGADGLAATVLAGASILAVGQTLTTGFRWALAESPSSLAPDAAQALNAAANDVVLVSAAGWFILAIAAWLAIVRGAALPTWLGWVSLVIGLLVITPLELIGFLVFVVWTAVVGVLVWRRWSDEGAGSTTTTGRAVDEPLSQEV